MFPDTEKSEIKVPDFQEFEEEHNFNINEKVLCAKRNNENELTGQTTKPLQSFFEELMSRLCFEGYMGMKEIGKIYQTAVIGFAKAHRQEHS